MSSELIQRTWTAMYSTHSLSPRLRLTPLTADSVLLHFSMALASLECPSPQQLDWVLTNCLPWFFSWRQALVFLHSTLIPRFQRLCLHKLPLPASLQRIQPFYTVATLSCSPWHGWPLQITKFGCQNKIQLWSTLHHSYCVLTMRK